MFSKRFYLLFFTIGLLALSAFNLKKNVTVTGVLKNADSESYIYLFEYFGTEISKKDSTRNHNGEFAFKFDGPLPSGFYKIGLDREKSVLVILNRESFSLTADLNDLPNSLSTKGSEENEVYERFRKFNDGLTLQYQQINKEAATIQEKYGADPEQYKYQINTLQKRLDSLGQERKKLYSRIITENPGLFVSKFVQMFSSDNNSKESFFSEEDFVDTDLARGDMLPSKISIYMQRFVQQDPESWKQEATLLVKKCPVKNANKEVVYSTVIRNLANVDMDFARSLCKEYVSEFPESRFAKELLNAFPKAAPSVGEPAPDLSLATPDGKIISLSSLRGKVVLLDFWASWCGPCRRENPNVVNAYRRFKDKGFTVYSVSLDTDKAKWIKAIEADHLEWENHVSDLAGWQSQAAKQYGVHGIPNTFLLDKEGNVVAMNLRGESLIKALEQLLE